MGVNNQGSMHPTPPPFGGRTLAVVHNAMYDAWAACDAKAVGTRFGGGLRRPAAERTEANKRKAVSFAAHRIQTGAVQPTGAHPASARVRPAGVTTRCGAFRARSAADRPRAR